MDKREAYACCAVCFVGISSFCLGKLSAIESNRTPAVIEACRPQEVAVKASVAPKNAQNKPINSPNDTLPEVKKGQYVGSRSSDKYHLPECSGAKRIAESNKIWFQSREEAERAGYAPALNCPGM